MKFKGKKQCWEHRQCGKDKDRSCPAYPNYGRLCWPIAGTKCQGRVRGIYAQTIQDCEACDFFQAVVWDGIS